MAENTEKVVLYQFPPAPTVRNISPFCLKVETYLRIHNIPYENVFTMKARSKYGLLPYITLNGEHIADSNLIIEKLKIHFNIKEPLSAHDQGLARAVDKMVDQHTFALIYKYKIYDNPERFVSMIPLESVPKPFLGLVRSHIARGFKKKVTQRIHSAFGPFSDEEFKMLLRNDFTALRDILENKPFLFGDQITLADCTLFGHLAGVYFLPIETEVKPMLDEEFPALVEYTKRVRDCVFPTDFTAPAEPPSAT